MFDNKTLLICGGTGSFGNAVLDRFLNSNIKEIRILSRDEKKQDDMRKFYNNSKIKFYIGDVRDKSSVDAAMYNVDYVFHAAALKQVPSCEFYPMQAVKTNIIGTSNVIDAAVKHGVKKVICLSTDKSVYPINAMGMSKALMEKVVVAKGREVAETNTVVCCTRYGNVMASRGSVIPLFINQIKNNKPISLTDPDMTRFMMSLDEAVDLVLFAFENASSGDIFVQKSPAATMGLLATSLKKLLGRENHPVNIIGTRHGEKKHESLLTREEKARAIDLGRFYRVPPDGRDLNYTKYFEDGEKTITESEEYNSLNTYQLNLNELTKMLSELKEIQNDIKEFTTETA